MKRLRLLILAVLFCAVGGAQEATITVEGVRPLVEFSDKLNN